MLRFGNPSAHLLENDTRPSFPIRFFEKFFLHAATTQKWNQ